MNITEVNNTDKKITLSISNIERLDPINVCIEYDTCFQIAIECFGSSWNATWGLPKKGYVDFFCSNNHEYLIGCLDPSIQKYEPNFDTFKIEMRQKIREWRRDNEISADLARELFDIENWKDHVSSNPYEPIRNLPSYHDDELKECELFTFDVPERLTSQYQYLTRIVKAVQEALKLNNEVVA